MFQPVLDSVAVIGTKTDSSRNERSHLVTGLSFVPLCTATSLGAIEDGDFVDVAKTGSTSDFCTGALVVNGALETSCSTHFLSFSEYLTWVNGRLKPSCAPYSLAEIVISKHSGQRLGFYKLFELCAAYMLSLHVCDDGYDRMIFAMGLRKPVIRNASCDQLLFNTQSIAYWVSSLLSDMDYFALDFDSFLAAGFSESMSRDMAFYFTTSALFQTQSGNYWVRNYFDNLISTC